MGCNNACMGLNPPARTPYQEVMVRTGGKHPARRSFGKAGGSMRLRRNSVAFLAAVLFLFCLTPAIGILGAPKGPKGSGTASVAPPAAPSAPSNPATASTGLIESAKVSLILLDVEVADDKAQPLTGLAKSDFEVTLDYKSWPIYSVDDLCSAEAPSGEEGGVPTSGSDAPTGGGRGSLKGESGDKLTVGAPLVAARTAGRFILYFDFSELQADGRHRALEQAKRWVSKVMLD